MATTLVGFFDSVRDAERAREDLLRQGLPRNTVHVTDNQSLMSRSRTPAHEVGEKEHRGFFARLFDIGEDDDRSRQYSEAVRSGSAMLTVVVEDESRIQQIQSQLERTGASDVDRRSQGTGGRAAQSATAGETFKVMEEELQVGKRDVETGAVRVRQHVTERPVHEQIRLCEEHAIVERRPVDREASPGELDALSMQDREFEIREHAEQAVVGKRARVVEEVRIGKEASERTETIDDSVRRTDVDVEQLAAQRGTPRSGTSRTPPPAR